MTAIYVIIALICGAYIGYQIGYHGLIEVMAKHGYKVFYNGKTKKWYVYKPGLFDKDDEE